MNNLYRIEDNNITVNVWSPKMERLYLRDLNENKIYEMNNLKNGFKTLELKNAINHDYYFVYNNNYPDPVSRYQPYGVSGPSRFIDYNYEWKTKKWKTYDIKDTIIEEIHIGTYTENGDYNSILNKIDYIKDTGVNTIEIMPLNQTYGKRNWGYDGVLLYAPSNNYGTANELKNLIDKFHENDINVILDVVYNHIGPIGNVLNDFGYYFSNIHKNPWGETFNYDGYGSDFVRSFIIENVDYWINEYKFDGLRLDAIHSVYDSSPLNIINEISLEIRNLEKKLKRKIKAIAESDKNNSSLVKPFYKCGYGLTAHWNDDFHHAVYSYLSGENNGYYSDYNNFDDITHCYNNGYVYDGRFSEYLNKTRGTIFNDKKYKLIAFDSDHDQIGNRAFGERPIKLLGIKKMKLFVAALLLSPFTPMLFQGEEYGEDSPFLFFIQTDDKNFADMIFNGRKDEFSDFKWGKNIPDPNDIDTFNKSKLKWKINKDILNYYKNLINIRKKYIKGNCTAYNENDIIKLVYEKINVYLSFSGNPKKIDGNILFSTSGSNILNEHDVIVTDK